MGLILISLSRESSVAAWPVGTTGDIGRNQWAGPARLRLDRDWCLVLPRGMARGMARGIGQGHWPGALARQPQWLRRRDAAQDGWKHAERQSGQQERADQRRHGRLGSGGGHGGARSSGL